MYNYEAMYIVKPDLSEDERKAVFTQIGDAVAKAKGSVSAAVLWSEKRRMIFPIKKQIDGLYYLVNFSAPSTATAELNSIYKLNENILRVLITRLA
jgi:small subunit ribosomal protein S6